MQQLAYPGYLAQDCHMQVVMIIYALLDLKAGRKCGSKCCDF